MICRPDLTAAARRVRRPSGFSRSHGTPPISTVTAADGEQHLLGPAAMAARMAAGPYVVIFSGFC
jgi:hypothetical protein